MDISLPIGGVTDRCGICGREISPQSEIHIGLLGLNGVACSDCSVNINHYTPGWYALESARNQLEIFTYTGHPGTPFYEASVRGVFLDVPEAADHDPLPLQRRYESLDRELQELIWSLPASTLPDGYTEITPAWEGDHSVSRPYRYQLDDDSEHPMTQLTKHLPRPFAVTPNSVVVLDEQMPEHARKLLNTDSPLAEEDAAQEQLGDATAQTSLSDSSPSKTRKDETETGPSDSETAEQAGLTSFC